MATTTSIKGVIEVAEFLTYDYSKLYPDNWLFDFFMQPAVPFVSVVLYLTLSTPICQILLHCIQLH